MTRMNRTKKPLQGIVTPLVTPLTEDCQLDIGGLERLIEHVIRGGVHGVFVLGTTGEGPSLCRELQEAVIMESSRIVNGRVPICVGITAPAIRDSVELAEVSAESGCDYAVAAPPYYFPLSQRELFEYFKQLLFEMPLPTLLYNMPAVAGMSIAPETFHDLLDCESFVGIKDSSGDLDYFQKVLETVSKRDDFTVMIGPEHLLLQSLELGGDGGVAGGSNIDPVLFVQLYKAATSGNQEKSSPLMDAVAKLGEIYDVGPRTIPGIIARTKAALAICQLCSDQVAPPLLRSSPTERGQIKHILEQITDLNESQASITSWASSHNSVRSEVSRDLA